MFYCVETFNRCIDLQAYEYHFYNLFIFLAECTSTLYCYFDLIHESVAAILVVSVQDKTFWIFSISILIGLLEKSIKALRSSFQSQFKIF